MTKALAFDEIGRLPLPGDNVAIATRRLEAGTRFDYDGDEFNIDYTVLEGHRFAIQRIASGEALLSWQLPFGFASTEIEPGNYVCNESTLGALSGRQLDFPLPDSPNFYEQIKPYQLDETHFQPAEPLRRYEEEQTFAGFERSGNRGVGTRNYIVLLGTTSRVGAFVKRLEARLQPMIEDLPNIDGIVAVAHTEGGDTEHPNNLHLTLPTLAGFMVNPNVGAVLAVDDGIGAVTNEALRAFMVKNGYALDDVRHHLFTLEASFSKALEEATNIVEAFLPQVNGDERAPHSLAHLKIALQCGGSDAFSGVSGNPLAGWVAREVIRYGGSANLAETDELIGAEPYVLQKVRDLKTARKFLSTIERFKEWASWHGASAEGNPSGGNKFRGLYNIMLKSIGAAMKRNPDVPLDYVIDYAEPMNASGYYFMDSPGNDLESIAGQVASGCNMIFFVTGNGSVTNFPFVPTIKIVTTTERFTLLHKDMDVNAGRYLDGMDMDDLGAEMFDLTVSVASGQRSVGEKAGHAQVQLWRNWRQQAGAPIDEITQVDVLDGMPIEIAEPSIIDSIIGGLGFWAVDYGASETRLPAPLSFLANSFDAPAVGQPVGLILPTSLCSAQVAQLTVRRLNQTDLADRLGVARFVALVHTEGCGSSPAANNLSSSTLLNYLHNPLVAHALLLEHGCETTHNDHMLQAMHDADLDPANYGWASIQIDGGIQQVVEKIERWFEAQVPSEPREKIKSRFAGHRFALSNDGPISPDAAAMLAYLTQQIVQFGGTVIVPSNATLLKTNPFQAMLDNARPDDIDAIQPTLAYGQYAKMAGFHIMATPTSHWVETLVGLGATGVEGVIVHAGQLPVIGHPLVPVLQIASDADILARFGEDIDVHLTGKQSDDAHTVAEQMTGVLSGSQICAADRNENVDFQMTRGLLGITL